jgi:hypothetical protein
MAETAITAGTETAAMGIMGWWGQQRRRGHGNGIANGNGNGTVGAPMPTGRDGADSRQAKSSCWAMEFKNPADAEQVFEGMRKAGLPE